MDPPPKYYDALDDPPPPSYGALFPRTTQNSPNSRLPIANMQMEQFQRENRILILIENENRSENNYKIARVIGASICVLIWLLIMTCDKIVKFIASISWYKKHNS